LITGAIAAIALPPQIAVPLKSNAMFYFQLETISPTVPKINVLTIEIMVNKVFLSCSHCMDIHTKS
jgi:hypothetical protein